MCCEETQSTIYMATLNGLAYHLVFHRLKWDTVIQFCNMALNQGEKMLNYTFPYKN